MCPLWPFHLVFVYVTILAPLWILSTSVVAHVTTNTQWGVDFNPDRITNLPIGNVKTVSFSTTDLSKQDIDSGTVTVVADPDGTIADVNPSYKTYILKTEVIKDGNWSSAFNITGNFLGHTQINLQLKNATGHIVKKSDSLHVTVVRPQRLFLVSIIYINFGCALDWSVFKKTIRKPVGPIIGFISQFLLMPVLSFGLGKVLFPTSVAMQLGMFFTGVSPAGGASNIWTYILGGNLNLSITMTTISTFAAFAMMPFWIFTLGQNNCLNVDHYFESACILELLQLCQSGLVIPLAIGFLHFKNVYHVCARLWCPHSEGHFIQLLRIFALSIIFAIITNLYLFQLFTWRIVIAGLGLPWLGYIGGLLMARICKQTPDDILAISIETGIQNTGIAIFLLQFSLGQPEADLTTVVPVSVAIMTPLPLLLLFIYYKCSARWKQSKGTMINAEEEEKIPTLTSTNGSTEPFTLSISNIKYRRSHLHYC
ncbi:hypothetical protein L9F63_007750 [Diploptera punctata]|uniref:Ileal sodium/bile acid cotransporter n=1 Tax=Diploptera punctata TaxID=6984 RepID=A0AAD7Z6P5_DIPPU|nr:hypothetical protein L9F63_007750 [Diploptera punctata]